MPIDPAAYIAYLQRRGYSIDEIRRLSADELSQAMESPATSVYMALDGIQRQQQQARQQEIARQQGTFGFGLGNSGASIRTLGQSRSVGNVDWESIAAFQGMNPQDQAALRAQGLAPQIATSFIGNGNPNATPGGTLAAGYSNPSFAGMPGFNAQGQFGGSPIEEARSMGFRPTGPSGEWAGQALSFMNNARQQRALQTQGAQDQLGQRAAASGDTDRLEFKKARLHRQLQAGNRAGGLQDQMNQTNLMLGQAQLAQTLAQPLADSPGVAMFRSQLGRK